MIEVYSNPDPTIVGFLKSELDAAGIYCYIQNLHTSSGIVDMPSVLFWPVLCIIDDADIENARAIVDAFMAARKHVPASPPDWICKKCGESVPGTIARCWNCEEPKSDL